MSTRRGPPKHQNKYAWKPNAGCKINETEVGSKLRPFSEVTGVCPRCKGQIEWKRQYGKYKPLAEPAKCQRCSIRAVRQAYHSLCTACAKEQNVCAKCCCRVDHLVGRDLSEVEAEKKMLEQAIKTSRERERRTLLRAMNKGKTRSLAKPQFNNEIEMGDQIVESAKISNEDDNNDDNNSENSEDAEQHTSEIPDFETKSDDNILYPNSDVMFLSSC